MTSSTTTSGDIINQNDHVAGYIHKAEYNLATRIQDTAEHVKDRVTEDFIAATAQAERVAQTSTLANSLNYQNLTAQANQVAATETLAASLAYQNGTSLAYENARNTTNLATTNASAAAAQADRVAQSSAAQVERVAAANVIATALQAQQDAAQAERLAAATGAQIAIAATEARFAAQAQVLAGWETRALIAKEGDVTRALINSQYVDTLRDKNLVLHNELTEIRNDLKNRDRDYTNLNQNFLQSQLTSQLNALNSSIQQVHQTVGNKNISFGAGAVTGGATTSNVA